MTSAAIALPETVVIRFTSPGNAAVSPAAVIAVGDTPALAIRTALVPSWAALTSAARPASVMRKVIDMISPGQAAGAVMVRRAKVAGRAAATGTMPAVALSAWLKVKCERTGLVR